MAILIDGSKGSKSLMDYPPLDQIGELASLDFDSESGNKADACFDGNGPRGPVTVGIELKKISDLLASRQTNRLQSIDGQVASMLRTYDECWILTYGTYRCNPQTGVLEHPRKSRGSAGFEWIPYTFNGSRDGKPILYSFVESTLISLSDLGIRHHHVYDLQQAALWIATLHAKRQQSWKRQCHMFQSLNDTKSVQESSYRRATAGLKVTDDDDSFNGSSASNSGSISPMPAPIDPVEYQITKVAAAFDTIKYKRAIAIAKQFDSVEDLMQAAIDGDVGRLQQVDGVGKIIAREFVRAVKMCKSDCKSRKPKPQLKPIRNTKGLFTP